MRGFSDVTVCGVLDFKKQGEMENNEKKKGVIWEWKYNGLGMQWECVRSSAWVPEVLKIWGKVGFENKR